MDRVEYVYDVLVPMAGGIDFVLCTCTDPVAVGAVVRALLSTGGLNKDHITIQLRVADPNLR